MAVYIGVWVDHEKAYIVRLVDGKVETKKVDSQVESHYHFSGGSRSKSPYGPQEVVSERKYEQRRREHLKKYYQNVIHCCKDADSLLILGPGVAKGELHKQIELLKDFAPRIVGTETVDKMTEKQIVAKVKKRFLFTK